jgi:hypothetical protein
MQKWGHITFIGVTVSQTVQSGTDLTKIGDSPPFSSPLEKGDSPLFSFLLDGMETMTYNDGRIDVLSAKE